MWEPEKERLLKKSDDLDLGDGSGGEMPGSETGACRETFWAYGRGRPLVGLMQCV